MDRGTSPRSPRAWREPHARGDGPSHPHATERELERAPRTWGWTDRGERHHGRQNESPTHVGMDRGSTAATPTPSGEPHARGDGPAAIAGVGAVFARAPRTWGWTVLPQDAAHVAGESPTHVGMDRGATGLLCGHQREPHARGDGPPRTFTLGCFLLRAPRTWGWTDPDAWQHIPANREPHARGDGPSRARTASPRSPRAPRTWGWTEGIRCSTVVPSESPTHVGMDRAGVEGGRGSSGEPHARGDGPPSSRRSAKCG